MTGRELIIYILRNHLEDEQIVKDGVFVGFISEDKVAVKFGVGVATVRTWFSYGMIKGVRIGDRLYFPNDVTDPRKTNEER